MDVKKVEIIEKYVISEGTRKLTHKQKIKAAEDMFKEKYQGKILPYKVLEKDMFVKINSKTRQNFSAHLKREGNKAHYDKLSATSDGNYIKMISNPTYEKTLKEKNLIKVRDTKKNSCIIILRKLL